MPMVAVMGCGMLYAEDRKVVEERASSTFVITKPEKSPLEPAYKSLDSAKGKCGFDMKDVDDDIQQWFDRQRSEQTSYFKDHTAKWDELTSATKQAARETLSKVEEKWKASVDKARQELADSEDAFYAAQPTLTVGGTYRYFEGQREVSAVKDAWTMDESEQIKNASKILGEEPFDSGEVILKVAGEETPVLKVRCVWSVSVKAEVESPIKAGIQGYANCPDSGFRCRPYLVSEYADSKKIEVWKFDATETKAGPIKLTISNSKLSADSGIRVKSRGELGAFRGEIKAGQELQMPSMPSEQ